MCGIAGIVLGANRELPDLERRVTAMREALALRGPDGAGNFVSPDGRVALANRRLAIQDLSPAAHMPMCAQHAAGQVALTYNGEIYNVPELRPQLERAGHSFVSTGDAEVVLRGYLEWGAGVVTRLRGMFAFAIYDGRAEIGPRVFFARDRIGIKPLVYAQVAEGWVFASELKALLASGLVAREIDATALAAYLMLGSVPNPRTIYAGVRSLEPGCTLTLELEQFNPRIERYWSFDSIERGKVNADEVVEATRAQLADAVRSHLVSDAPLGAFLSGGLDSSAVTALMREGGANPIRTCTMVFEENEFSEAAFARATAAALGAEHYERVITAQDVRDALPRIFAAMDQPTIDGVNTYFVSQTAREAGLTVALSGLGGDELFGGYRNTFIAAPRLERNLRWLARVPAGNQLARWALRAAPNGDRYARASAALSAPPSPAAAYFAYRGLFSPAQARALLSKDAREGMDAFDPLAYIAGRAGRAEGFVWSSRAELSTYTHNQLLRDTDVMSMAHSLEVRVPLLDHRLVEFALGLPDSAKRNGGAVKPLLVRAVGDLLPPVVRERRNKQGFVFPFDRWLRGQLGKGREGTSRWLDAEAVAQVRRGFEQGRVHWSRVWALKVAQEWLMADSG